MDQAIYESTTNKIYGVRGQWLYKFNATTGAREGSLRFCNESLGRSSITAIAGVLYISPSLFPRWDHSWGGFSGTQLPWNIYKVTASTMISAGVININTVFNMDPQISYNTLWGLGFHNLITDGSQVIVSGQGDPLFSVNPLTYNPGNPATYGVADYESVFMDAAYDSLNGVVWVFDISGPDIVAQKFPFAIGEYTYLSGFGPIVTGITFNNLTNHAYLSTGGSTIVQVSAVDTIGWSNLTYTVYDTFRANCNAARIKSCNNLTGNPYNGKVLIPAWKDNTVLIWDAATNLVGNMVVKSGFEAPFDIVHAPTKSFAVQTGQTQLKEIT